MRKTHHVCFATVICLVALGMATNARADTAAEEIRDVWESGGSDHDSPLVFQDRSWGLFSDVDGDGVTSVGDHIFTIFGVDSVFASERRITPGNDSIKDIENNGSPNETMSDGNSNELTGIIGLEIANIIFGGGGPLQEDTLEFRPIGSATGGLVTSWTLIGINGSSVTFTPADGFDQDGDGLEDTVGFLFDDSSNDLFDAEATVEAKTAAAINGTLLAIFGFSTAPNIGSTGNRGGANADGEYAINRYDGGGNQFFELNLNFLDALSGAGLTDGLGAPHKNNIGQNTATSAFTYGDETKYGSGAQFYGEGAFASGQGEFIVTDNGKFAILMPTPIGVLVGLGMFGLLAVVGRRKRKADQTA